MYTYQWERCDEEEDECDEVAGATRSTYTLVSRDVGFRLRVVVTATNARGDDLETSDATEVVRASSGTAGTTRPGASRPGTSATTRTVRGTRRADVLLGTSGNDRILPGLGADTVVAREGDDVIEAADGVRDVIVCGPGRDTVTADRRDVLRECEVVRYPARGRVFRGTRRADLLVGGAGNDTFLPGAGRDTIVAGEGNDRVKAVDGFRDVIVCGEGRDTVDADRSDVLRGCEIVRYARLQR
jgi:Ca2+-binding RTX toxin-like protein